MTTSPRQNVRTIQESIEQQRTLRVIGSLRAIGFPYVPMWSPHDEPSFLNPDTLDRYLEEVTKMHPAYGKSHFTARELVKAKYPEKAGQEFLIPPVKWWPRIVLLRWFADLVRQEEPVYVAHLYRPEPYNSEVGSESQNHVHCCAIDLDFHDGKSFMYALKTCEKLYHSPLHLSVGYGVSIKNGGGRIHVDFFSPTAAKFGYQRPRWWSYNDLYKGPFH